MTNPTIVVSMIVGILGFSSAILTLIFTNKYNLKNYKLQENKDFREKSKSYSRVFGSLLKVYHSYIKYKHLYNDNGEHFIPDNILIQMIDKIDTFQFEIKKFRNVVEIESEIIPELTMYIHELLEILSRLELLSEFMPLNDDSEQSKQGRLLIKRAQSYAVQELLDEYFDELIALLSDKCDVDEKFLNDLKEFNSEKTIKESIEVQKKIMDRFFESLSKQTGDKLTIEDFIPANAV